MCKYIVLFMRLNTVIFMVLFIYKKKNIVCHICIIEIIIYIFFFLQNIREIPEFLKFDNYLAFFFHFTSTQISDWSFCARSTNTNNYINKYILINIEQRTSDRELIKYNNRSDMSNIFIYINSYCGKF